MFLGQISRLATFNDGKMAKATLATGEFLFAGLNCFEPGQDHSLHAHEGQDKLYVILEGTAEVQVGEQRQLLAAGDGAFAPCGAPHSIHNPGPGRLVVLAVLAPPPHR